jgi:hypothetical protein
VFTGLAPRLTSVLLPQAAAAHQRLLEALAARPDQLDQRAIHEQMLDARNYVKILGECFLDMTTLLHERLCRLAAGVRAGRHG